MLTRLANIANAFTWLFYVAVLRGCGFMRLVVFRSAKGRFRRDEMIDK